MNSSVERKCDILVKKWSSVRLKRLYIYSQNIFSSNLLRSKHHWKSKQNPLKGGLCNRLGVEEVWEPLLDVGQSILRKYCWAQQRVQIFEKERERSMHSPGQSPAVVRKDAATSTFSASKIFKWPAQSNVCPYYARFTLPETELRVCIQRRRCGLKGRRTDDRNHVDVTQLPALHQPYKCCTFPSCCKQNWLFKVISLESWDTLVIL